MHKLYKYVKSVFDSYSKDSPGHFDKGQISLGFYFELSIHQVNICFEFDTNASLIY